MDGDGEAVFHQAAFERKQRAASAQETVDQQHWWLLVRGAVELGAPLVDIEPEAAAT